MQQLVIILALFGVIGFSAWYYYTDTQATIETLRANNVTLELANKDNLETISTLEKEKEEAEEKLAALQVKNDKAEEYQDYLIAILQSHDLTRLALRKPGMIEKRMNDGTKEIFDDLESLTSQQ